MNIVTRVIANCSTCLITFNPILLGRPDTEVFYLPVQICIYPTYWANVVIQLAPSDLIRDCSTCPIIRVQIPFSCFNNDVFYLRVYTRNYYVS